MSQREAIIKALLQGPKTREDLREALGKERVGDFSKDISSLMKEIVIELPGQRIKKKRRVGRPKKGEKSLKTGPVPGTLSISQDPSTYREIWRGYPNLQDVLMKVPSVQEQLMKTWRNIYQFYEGTPEAEDFKSSLLIPTFFRWHIEKDPGGDTTLLIPEYPLKAPPDFPLSSKWLFEWSILSGEAHPLFARPQVVIREFTRKAAFNDYFEGCLTEEGKKVLEKIHSDETTERTTTEARDRAWRISRLFGILDPSLDNVSKGKERPIFREEVARELRDFIKEYNQGMKQLSGRKDLTPQEKNQMILQHIINKGEELASRYLIFLPSTF